MTEIPDDVMKIAEAVVDRIAKQHVLRGDCVADVALSIMTERERCARIAEDAEPRLTETMEIPPSQYDIAAAIRKYPIDFMRDGCDNTPMATKRE